MRDTEPRPIGRLGEHARASFDAIIGEALAERMRDLVEKLRQVEPVKSPLDSKEPPSSED
jgi:hypothetical protein